MPLIAFTVPASLYRANGALGTSTRSLHREVVLVRVDVTAPCCSSGRFMTAGLAKWKSTMDAALRRAPQGVWGEATLTITHQTGGTVGVRL